MGTAHLGDVLRHLRRLAGGPGDADLTDGQLLERFRGRGEEAAFAVLVQRHGPMVLAACRRLLPTAQDAEDAFQATFFVLARKAGSIHARESVAGWLYGVACRVAVKARGQEARRRTRERRAVDMARAEQPDTVTLQELRAVLDEELGGLPEKYRAPLVLCYLEGKTHEQAARELGCPRTSLSSRLSRARGLLRQRLARRGLALTAALLAGVLAQTSAPAAVPALLTIAAVQAGVVAVAGGPAAGPVSGRAVSLAEGVLRAMAAARVRIVTALLLVVTLVGAGAGVLCRRGLTAAPPAPPAAGREAPAPEAPRPARLDRLGDRLPEGALVRLGTVRFRHGSTVTGLAFAPDGKTLVSASYDKTIRVWDPANGKELRRLPALGGSVYQISLSRDGKTLVATDQSLVYLGDLTAGRLTQAALQPVEVHTCVALSPDATVLAAGCRDTAGAAFPVRLWEAATGRPLGACQGHTAEVKCAAFAPDGKTLATGGADNSVRLWDPATGREALRLNGKSAVQAVAFSEDGRLLAAGGEDRKLRLWRLPEGKLLHEVGEPYPGVDAIAFAPDGKAVAAAGGSGPVSLWDLATGKELRRIRGYGLGLAFSPDGKTLATGGHACTIQLWDVATGKERTSAEAGHQHAVRAMSVSADGAIVATCGGDRLICLWETATGRELRRLKANTPYIPKVALSPDAKVVASNYCLWEVATGKVLGRFKDQDYGIDALAFSPDGRSLAMATTDVTNATRGRLIRLWDPASLKEVRHFGEQPVHALAWSPDGKTLAAGNGDGTVGVWDTASGRELRRIPGHRREVNSVAFAPDGTAVASSSFDGDIFLWDPATGKQLGRLVRDQPPGTVNVIAVAFAPDGRTLASAEGPFTSPEGESITVWELATGRVRLRLTGHQGDVDCLAFAGDGKTLVSSSTDTTALVWDLTAPLRPAGTGDLSRAALEACWADLRAPEAPRAYRAVCTLAASPAGVAVLREHLPPAQDADPQRLARLVRALDSDAFDEREKANRELETLGETAEPVIRKLLEGRPSAEVRRRLGQLLDEQSAEWLRTRRAVESLELADTPKARQLLQALAEGTPEARLTREAKAALDRLTRRPAPAP